MIKSTNFIVAVILLVLSTLTFYACDQEEPEKVSELIAFFDSNLANATQTFTVEAASTSTITGAKGTRIQVFPNSFQDDDGNIVSGSIDIELTEILDLKDMVMMNKPTTSEGRLLTTGGELKVSALQNGQALNLSPNARMVFNVPTTTADPNMELFLGQESDDGTVEWLTADTLGLTGDSLIAIEDTANLYYWFNIGDYGDDDWGWINCDYFYGDSNPTTSISIKPNEGHDATNTNVWLYVPSANSLAGTFWNGTDAFVFNQIPESLSVTVIALSEIEDEYFSSFSTITVTTDHTVDITLAPTTLTQFEADLENL